MAGRDARRLPVQVTTPEDMVIAERFIDDKAAKVSA